MDKVINNTIIDYTRSNSTCQSSIDIDEERNNCMDDENFQDMLFLDGNEEGFKNYENEDVLMERVWFLSKPPIVPRQLPTVSTRQIQVTRQRLLSTIKKPSSLVETLRSKVEDNLKQQRRRIKELPHNANK